jgi:hypothetical protein
LEFCDEFERAGLESVEKLAKPLDSFAWAGSGLRRAVAIARRADVDGLEIVLNLLAVASPTGGCPRCSLI